MTDLANILIGFALLLCSLGGFIGGALVCMALGHRDAGKGTPQ